MRLYKLISFTESEGEIETLDVVPVGHRGLDIRLRSKIDIHGFGFGREDNHMVFNIDFKDKFNGFSYLEAVRNQIISNLRDEKIKIIDETI